MHWQFISETLRLAAPASFQALSWREARRAAVDLPRDAARDLRLECFRAQLRLRGRDLRRPMLAVLGGSISAGSSWSVQQANWTYHAKVAQALGMRHHNGALPGTGPAFFEHCAEGQLPPGGADLILLEFAVNLDDDIAAFERLLRKLLQIRGRPGQPLPALVAVNAHEWTVDARRPGCSCKKMAQMPLICARVHKARTEPQSAAEQKVRRLCRHYGIPVVSLRAGLAERLRTRSSRFEDLMLDCRHPSGDGHTLLAQMVLARLLANDTDAALTPSASPSHAYLSDDAAMMTARCAPFLSSTLSRSLRLTRSLPPPLSPAGMPTPSSRCARGARLAPLVISKVGFVLSDEGRRNKLGYVATAPGAEIRLCLLGHGAVQKSSGPMRSGRRINSHAPTSCLDRSPAAACAEVFQSGHCWDRYFKCRASCSMCSNATRGVIVPGSIGSQQQQQQEEEQVVLWLGFLRSWEHMGRAQLRCEGGCECEVVMIDAHNSAFRNSVTAVQRAVLTLHVNKSLALFESSERKQQGDACGCVMRLTVQSETSSGEHKFKLLSVLLAPPRPDAKIASEWDPPGTRLHADAVLDLMHRNSSDPPPMWEVPRRWASSRKRPMREHA